MKALVTGASSGIGRDIAIYLASKGYDVVIAARRENLLQELKKQIEEMTFAKDLKADDTPAFKVKVFVEVADVSKVDECKSLYEKHPDIDMLVNNAGFGKYGEFNILDLDDDISMINTNITGLHVLTKLYLNEMIKNNKGYILNVASSAGLMPGGPLMATYYATKSYVVSLTRAISQELKLKGSNVKISCLCPGPVDTNFNNVAKVQFSLKGLSSKYVARYAIDKTLEGKLTIVPGISMKVACFGCRFVPTRLMLKMVANQQKKKGA